MSHVQVTKEKRLAIITISSALDKTTVREARAAVDSLALNKQVGTLVITGAGDCFVPEGEMHDLKGRDKSDALSGQTSSLFTAVENFPCPVIAAINGPALGDGFELALACDLRIAAETARFGFPETGWGIIPGAGGTQRLPRLIGLARAKHMIFTGQVLDALEAERMGLVSWVEPRAELMNAARTLAKSILARGPLAVRLAKLALNASVQDPRGAMVETLAEALCLDSADKAEGAAAFFEKRRPKFQGK
jgi:enoyl-CoA hydratase/carnithine racemase